MERRVKFFPLCLILASISVIAAERSRYDIGALEFGRQIIPTSVGNDIFVYLEDVNSDGYTDFVVTGYTPVNTQPRGGNAGAILLNNGDNTFVLAEGDAPQSEWAREILVRDFNGDRINDIFIADHGWDIDPFPGFKNQLLLGTENGFIDATDRLPNIDDFSHNAAAGDIDNDGDIDILVTNNPLGNVDELPYLLINDGTAQFTLNRDLLPASFTRENDGQWSWAVAIADMDNDGWKDLVVGRREDSQPSRVYWNTGSGGFTDTLVTNLPDMTEFVANGLYSIIEIQAFDVDHDNDLDLLMSAYDIQFKGVGIQLLVNDNSSLRSFSDRTQLCLSGQTQTTDQNREPPYFFRQMDINFDGVQDIAAFGSFDVDDNTILAFEGAGGGKLRALTVGPLSSDDNVRYRLGRFPTRGENEFGFVEIFHWDNNGDPSFGFNYVPITSTPMQKPAVEFDACSNVLSAELDAGSSGKATLNFSLTTSGSDVLVQAIPDSVQYVETLQETHATFDGANGELLLPELVVDEAVAYRNVRFNLIDSTQLIFRLSGADGP